MRTHESTTNTKRQSQKKAFHHGFLYPFAGSLCFALLLEFMSRHNHSTRRDIQRAPQTVTTAPFSYPTTGRKKLFHPLAVQHFSVPNKCMNNASGPSVTIAVIAGSRWASAHTTCALLYPLPSALFASKTLFITFVCSLVPDCVISKIYTRLQRVLVSVNISGLRRPQS